jgi:hypothetical protein
MTGNWSPCEIDDAAWPFNRDHLVAPSLLGAVHGLVGAGDEGIDCHAGFSEHHPDAESGVDGRAVGLDGLSTGQANRLRHSNGFLQDPGQVRHSAKGRAGWRCSVSCGEPAAQVDFTLIEQASEPQRCGLLHSGEAVLLMG